MSTQLSQNTTEQDLRMIPKGWRGAEVTPHDT